MPRIKMNITLRITVMVAVHIGFRRIEINAAGKSKIEVNRHIAKILMYSAINIRANGVPLYSTLNPETSSDSPSAKSNGARLVSAKMVTNHIKARGRASIAGQVVW